MRLQHCPHCGCELIKARSPRHHRFFFAVIAAAYDNWPEGHWFQPRSAEHLRGMLLTEVGEYDTIGNGVDAARPELDRLMDFVQMAMHQAHLSRYGKLAIAADGTMELRFPRSIAWAKMEQKDFSPLAEKIFQEIEVQTGLSLATLRRAAAPSVRARIAADQIHRGCHSADDRGERARRQPD